MSNCGQNFIRQNIYTFNKWVFFNWWSCWINHFSDIFTSRITISGRYMNNCLFITWEIKYDIVKKINAVNCSMNTFKLIIFEQSSIKRWVPQAFKLPASFKPSLNLTVAALWKTIFTVLRTVSISESFKPVPRNW